MKKFGDNSDVYETHEIEDSSLGVQVVRSLYEDQLHNPSYNQLQPNVPGVAALKQRSREFIWKMRYLEFGIQGRSIQPLIRTLHIQ